jgi:hypothetical protein
MDESKISNNINIHPQDPIFISFQWKESKGTLAILQTKQDPNRK